MSEVVLEILDRIKALSIEDRLTLDRCLAEIAEQEWREEAQRARQEARERGVDQAGIDRAVEDVRYAS